jgi:hypothetical protein
MGRLIAVVFTLLLVGGGYVLSPFVAAWNLREAIKTSDTATLERKVIWSSVRASLRASLAANAKLLPEVNEAGERLKSSLWQRVKKAFGQSMLDRFVESYVTAEGLPRLFRYRNKWNGTVKSEVDEDDKLDFFERTKAFYRRLHRAEFTSLTRIEIETLDKFDPERRYVSVMELHGFEWKLAELRIIGGAAKSGTTRVARDLIGVQ